MASIWVLRKPLVRRLAGDYLHARAVAGTYHIDSLDRNQIRLSNISIGEKDRPALTAKSMIIDLQWIGLSARPQKIYLDRPLLRATASPQGVNFGELDKLIPKSKGPIVLPAIDVTVRNGNILIMTPLGPMTAHVQAHGMLNADFHAHMALEPVSLTRNRLILKNAKAVLDVTISQSSIITHLAFNADSAVFSGCSAKNLSLSGLVIGPKTLNDFQYTTHIQSTDLSCKDSIGHNVVVASAGRYQADQLLNGTLHLTATDVASTFISTKNTECVGTFQISPKPYGNAATQCNLQMNDAALPGRYLGSLNKLQTSLLNSSFKSIATGPLASIKTAFQAMTIMASVNAKYHDGKAKITILHGNIKGHNDVELITSPTTSLTFQYPDYTLVGHGQLTITSGGVPELALDLKDFHQDATGTLRTQGRVTTSAIKLGPLTATASTIKYLYDDGLKISGRTTISGMLGETEIDRADLPLNFTINKKGDLQFFLQNNCLPISIRGIKGTTYALGAISTQLCPSTGEPLLMRSADGALHGSAHSGAMKLDIMLVGQPEPIHLNIDGFSISLSGQQARPYLNGNFSGIGALLNVYALSIADLSGSWSWSKANGPSLSRGHFTVSDQTPRPRFYPLDFTDINADIQQGIVTLGGKIFHAAATHLADFALMHNLAMNQGKLGLTMNDLEFGPKLQPYQLSELMRGVVENVSGGLDAHAKFSWTNAKLTSSADADIKAMSLATATLGPVNGINGHIVFDDFMDHTTPPGQIMHVAMINPGIAIADGIIRFQLLHGLQMKVEDARWPFFDGILRLEPVVLVPSDPVHHMTVSIDNIDVAQFLQQMDFKDLNATGHLTGRFPMVFTPAGGRIEHGVLKAATGGGVIQYVGNTGGTATGQAKIAFDALRDFRYDNVSLDVNGDLDGEIITAINFSGVNQIPIKPLGRWTTGAKNVPFKFGVKIKAPFRSLLKSVNSFTDARQIIREGEPVTSIPLK